MQFVEFSDTDTASGEGCSGVAGIFGLFQQQEQADFGECRAVPEPISEPFSEYLNVRVLALPSPLLHCSPVNVMVTF